MLKGNRFVFNQAGADNAGGGGAGASGAGADGGAAGAGTGAGAGSGAGAGAGDGGGKKDDGAIETISMPKQAFDERLSKASEAATRKLLRELGFENADGLKGALGTLKTLQDEKRSTQEKLESQIKELTPKAQRADVLAKRFEGIVETEFKKLPENLQTTIDKYADGDAEKRWERIEFLREAGMLSAETQSSAGGQQNGQQPPAGPANRAPAGGPPPKAGAAKTKFDEYAELQKTSPVRASLFYQLHGAAIEASRPAGA